MKSMIVIGVAAWLAAGCAAPQGEGPAEPAPEPPAMGAPAVTGLPMSWVCVDGTHISTRYLAGRDELELSLAGRTRLLSRIRRTPTAAWGDGEFSFGMKEGGTAVLRWEGEDVRCERDVPDVRDEAGAMGSARSPQASAPSHG